MFLNCTLLSVSFSSDPTEIGIENGYNGAAEFLRLSM